MFACSREAGEWLYGASDFIVLPNSFNLSAFSFDRQPRASNGRAWASTRAPMSLATSAVEPREEPCIPHRGLRAILAEARFFLFVLHCRGWTGRGARQGVNRGVSRARCDSAARQRVRPREALLSDDCFVFPSIHEGLGIVLVEAQLSGLPCIVSDDIPQGAAVSDQFTSVPLSAGADAWAEAIRALSNEERRGDGQFVDARADVFDIGIQLPAS